MGELANPYLKESVTNFLLVCVSQLTWLWMSHARCRSTVKGVGQLRGALAVLCVLELPGHGGLLRCEEEKKYL